MRNPWELLAYPAAEIKRPKPSRPATPKLKAGDQVHQWTLLEFLPGHLAYPGAPRLDARWKCRCSCGAVKLVFSANLLRGGSKSCGHDRNTGRFNRSLHQD